MSEQTPYEAYLQAIMAEREQYLYKRALNKAKPAMRGMDADARAEYIESKAFSSLLYHMQRSDSMYQAMKRGELIQSYHLEEFELLEKLIESELEHGHEIDLNLLRAADRYHIALKQAHRALRALEERAPQHALKAEVERLADEAEGKVERYLIRGDFTRALRKNEHVRQVVSHVMKTIFPKGITGAIVDTACQTLPLRASLRAAVDRACPDLKQCGPIILSDGTTVSETVKACVEDAHAAICGLVHKRFPVSRVRSLLNDNASLAILQKQADIERMNDMNLKSALLNAIPEHYRDLYPLARQLKRHFILHLGPTNSGKTYEGVEALKTARSGIYLGPLRLLAAEQFDTLNLAGTPTSLVTGEEQIRVPFSRVQSSTVEMADLKTHYDVAVIDECQMITDRDRGGAWTAAILGLCADEIHACASPDAEGLLTRIITECGDDLTVVRHHRMTPLMVEKEGFQFPGSVRKGDALIVFAKARVHAVAAELKRKGFRVSLIYGALPPDVRRDQAQRFSDGGSEVVVSTDAIAMGMNLPIQRVVFLESDKFDGDIVRPLTDAEIKQIAGRAGRYGIYDVGYVNAFGFKGMVSQALARPLYALTEAVIGFPESLLGIPLPLTSIINQWLSMKDKSCFSKASTMRMAALAAMLETQNTDKALLYRFICIPFDETDPDLLARWRAMYQAECRGEHIDVLSEIPEPPEPETCVVEMLDQLEAAYRKCDLYYNYARLFLNSPDETMMEIQYVKGQISQGIIHILSTQRLQQRTCPLCKAYMPWNWPYRLCDNCYHRARGTR